MWFAPSCPMYRVSRLLMHLGLTLNWLFHHLAQLLSRFCQISISPGRICGTLKTQVNQTHVHEQMGHPVCGSHQFTNTKFTSPNTQISKSIYLPELLSASIAQSQGLLESFCGSSIDRWAILQLRCSQTRRKLPEERTQKLSSKSGDRALDTLHIYPGPPRFG